MCANGLHNAMYMGIVNIADICVMENIVYMGTAIMSLKKCLKP